MENVSLPDGITTVAGFNGCESLKSIKIPDSVEKIGDAAFMGCKNLETVIFGKNTRVKTIDNNAFALCPKLVEFNLPTTVKAINTNAFAMSFGMGGSVGDTKRIYYNGTVEEFYANVRLSYDWRRLANVTLVCTDGEVENPN